MEHADWLADYDRFLTGNKSGVDEMPIIATDTGGGSNFTPIPQGAHIAVCDQIIYLGIHEESYNGGPIKFQPKAYLRFQVPSERVEINGEDKPAIIGNVYTVSTNEKANLRQHLEGWRGRAFTEEEAKAFDITNVLGKACQISVTHKKRGDKVYANITSIMALPKGMEAPQVEGQTVLFESPDDSDVYESLPRWLKEKIYVGFPDSEDPPAAATQHPAPAQFRDDDIPF